MMTPACDVQRGQLIRTQPDEDPRYQMIGTVQSRRTVNTGRMGPTTFIYLVDGRRFATTPNDLVEVLR